MSTLVDVPARVDGVQLIGEMEGSGYRNPPALVRRADGQILQLTPLLYHVLRAVDGRRSCAQIAELVGGALGRSVSEADVAALIDKQLRPGGLLRQADGSQPPVRRSNPLLRLKPRFAVTNPRTTRSLTDPFRVLFRPVIAAVVLVGFVAIVGWVFFERGLGASAYDAFERPHLLLLVFVVTVLSGGFHEFGHAAAARYSGAQPGAMGAGLYLVWPAFYTDVTDSYRLGRAGRIRTDLGGLYFNAVVVVLTFLWWWATGWEALLLLVATQVLQMVQQLMPLLRFDGYHLLADLAGVPDLYHRIRPTLLGLLPHRWNSPENRVLTARARAAITLWVLVAIPMMALMLLAVVTAVPRLLGSAGSVVREDAVALGRAWSSGSPIDIVADALQILGVVLPTVACAMILGRVGLRFFAGLARWSRGSAAKRVVAAGIGATVLTALMWAWWPQQGAYRPIQPGERGVVTSLFGPPEAAFVPASDARPARPAPAVPAGDTSGRLLADAAPTQLGRGGEPLVAVFEEGAALPTKDNPQVALVLVPAGDNTTEPVTGGSGVAPDDGTAGTGGTGGPPNDGQDDARGGPWVFPFDKPLPPAEGDNQALAVATSDDSVVYDVAFALVWAVGDEVLNVNEAHAYASCSNCVAVAVAFQVILVMDDAHVVAPQNLAVSANYDCYQCITAALASQLVLSVGEQPGEEQLLALSEVWNRITAFASSITSYSLTEIMDTLETFKGEIVAILGNEPMLDAGQAPSDSGAPDAGGGGGGGGDSTLPTSSEPSSPTAEATPEPMPTAASTPSSAPSPTAVEFSSASPAPSLTEPSAPTPSATESESTSTPSDSPSPSP